MERSTSSEGLAEALAEVTLPARAAPPVQVVRGVAAGRPHVFLKFEGREHTAIGPRVIAYTWGCGDPDRPPVGREETFARIVLSLLAQYNEAFDRAAALAAANRDLEARLALAEGRAERLEAQAAGRERQRSRHNGG